MSITTKTGDNGETSLLTGERVKKSGLRVDTYGTLDEVDSALGLARAFSDKDDVAERILKLQRKLPALMADFASCGTEPRITMGSRTFPRSTPSSSRAARRAAPCWTSRARRPAALSAVLAVWPSQKKSLQATASTSTASRITATCSCASKRTSTRTTEPSKKNLCPCRQRTIVQSSAGTFLHEDS